MMSGSAPGQWQRSIVLLSGTVVTVVAVTVLYWAQSIFIPVALAVFLTFLLNPVVSRLRLLGRAPHPGRDPHGLCRGACCWGSPVGS